MRGPSGVVTVEGRAAGALAWLRLSAGAAGARGLPPSPRFAAFLNARSGPAWIASADGRPVWANSAWLEAVGAADVESAAERGLNLDPAADALAIEAANLAQSRDLVRWVSLGGRRRALRLSSPAPGHWPWPPRHSAGQPELRKPEGPGLRARVRA